MSKSIRFLETKEETNRRGEEKTKNKKIKRKAVMNGGLIMEGF
jgi:hypothetical protein